MPALLIRCHVADYPAWKAAFAEDAPARRANGCQSEQLSRDADDSTMVLARLEWDCLARARLFVDADEWREALTRAGVVGEPDLWFLEEVDHPTV